MRNSRKGRFRVWDRAQDSFNGEDLVYNFDALDELIGGTTGTSGASTSNGFNGTPDGWLGINDAVSATPNKYPGTTNSGYEIQSGRRTLYSVVSGLNYNDVPLGTVIMWWRPNSSVPIPDGWVACDGRVIASADHSFPVGGSITVPDMRNKFAVGADSSVAGVNAVDGYALEAGATAASNVNNDWNGARVGNGAAGAPGIGYDSGFETSGTRSGNNVVRNLSHSHTPNTLAIKDHYHSIAHTHLVPRHKHKVADHSHDFAHVHLTPNHAHDFTFSGGFRTGTSVKSGGDAIDTIRTKEVANPFTGQRFATPDHVHNINLNNAGKTGVRTFVDSGYGLFAWGPQDDLWKLSANPKAMSSGRGYEYQAVTSYPTKRQHSGNVLNAHEIRTDTSTYSPAYGSEELFAGAGWAGVIASGEIQTNELTRTESISGGVTALDTSTIPASRQLTGTTSTENLYVNIRPQYVGLLYLMKVKVSTNII